MIDIRTVPKRKPINFKSSLRFWGINKISLAITIQDVMALRPIHVFKNGHLLILSLSRVQKSWLKVYKKVLLNQAMYFKCLNNL